MKNNNNSIVLTWLSIDLICWKDDTAHNCQKVICQNKGGGVIGMIASYVSRLPAGCNFTPDTNYNKRVIWNEIDLTRVSV